LLVPELPPPPPPHPAASAAARNNEGIDRMPPF
jgi:hypothetical protein